MPISHVDVRVLINEARCLSGGITTRKMTAWVFPFRLSHGARSAELHFTVSRCETVPGGQPRNSPDIRASPDSLNEVRRQKQRWRITGFQGGTVFGMANLRPYVGATRTYLSPLLSVHLPPFQLPILFRYSGGAFSGNSMEVESRATHVRPHNSSRRELFG